MTTERDLLDLVENRVPEGRTVEYKLTLPGGSDSDKREFLRDASSFANSSGGTIYFGIRELDGCAAEVVGLEGVDADAAIQRLENLLRDGIEPRLPAVALSAVLLPSSRFVLVAQIGRSWALPHSVRFQSPSTFYARNSNGKYPLDVGELRRFFSQSEALPARMREFRRARVALIEAGESPLTTQAVPKIVLHIVPLESFMSGVTLDTSRLEDQPTAVVPIGSPGNSWRHNFDGFVSFALAADPAIGVINYVQLFRNGCLEAVDTVLLRPSLNKSIPSVSFERKIAESLGGNLHFLSRSGIEPPVYVALSLLRVMGYYMGVDVESTTMETPTIERDEILVPEVAIDSLEVDPFVALRPSFDIVWNAAGWPSSVNYDADGSWRPMER